MSRVCSAREAKHVLRRATHMATHHCVFHCRFRQRISRLITRLTHALAVTCASRVRRAGREARRVFRCLRQVSRRRKLAASSLRALRPSKLLQLEPLWRVAKEATLTARATGGYVECGTGRQHTVSYGR